jgi:hypothetical protein
MLQEYRERLLLEKAIAVQDDDVERIAEIDKSLEAISEF